MAFASRRSSPKRVRPRFFANGVERLESRALLATASPSFAAPDLSGLIRQADQGVNTGPATIQRMLSALQTQLQSGPLGDLSAGTVGSTDAASEASTLITSFQANVDQQLSPRFPNIDKVLNLEATAIGSEFAALDAQATGALISDSTLVSQAGAAIDSLTSGPLRPLNTSNSGYVVATNTFEDNLNAVATSLSGTTTTPSSLFQAQTIANADAQAYGDAIAASLVTRPQVNQRVQIAVTDLQNTVAGINTGGTSTPAAQFTQAVTTFDQAVLGQSGVFGPNGPLRRR